MLLCRVSKAASSSVSTSFKEGQLHFLRLFIDQLTLTSTEHTHSHCHSQLSLSMHAYSQKHTYTTEKCTHLKYFATYVPVTALTPDPKLTVVVSLTVRYPISEQ